MPMESDRLCLGHPKVRAYGIMNSGHYNNQAIDDLGVVTNSYTTPLGNLETMMKTMAETTSCRTAGEPPPCL